MKQFLEFTNIEVVVPLWFLKFTGKFVGYFLLSLNVLDIMDFFWKITNYNF